MELQSLAMLPSCFYIHKLLPFSYVQMELHHAF
jgi:hypothetical protein